MTIDLNVFRNIINENYHQYSISIYNGVRHNGFSKYGIRKSKTIMLMVTSMDTVYGSPFLTIHRDFLQSGKWFSGGTVSNGSVAETYYLESDPAYLDFLIFLEDTFGVELSDFYG